MVWILKMFDWFKKKKQPPPDAPPEPVKQYKVIDGFQEFQKGNVAAAKLIFDAVLQTQPSNADALYLSGLVDSRQGRQVLAIEKISKAIAVDGSIPSYHLSLGGLWDAAGRPAEAIENYRRAVALDSEDPEMRCALGSALLLQHQYTEAFEHLSHAVWQNPSYALALFNLGVVCQNLGQLESAQQHYVASLKCNPRNAQAENNLGALLQGRGEYQAAMHCFERALAIQPDFALACLNMGITLQAHKRVDESQVFLERAIALDPQSFSARSNYALSLREQGRLDASLVASQAALAIRDDTAERIRMATLTPVVAMSAAEIGRWRDRFAEAVEELSIAHGVVSDPLREIGACNFNLAYQPECNKTLQESSARMYLANCPSLQFVAAHCLKPVRQEAGRIRVGFISRFMYQHSIGRTTRGVLAHLDREKFEVIALFIPPIVDDTVSQFIRGAASSFQVLPADLEQARISIAALELDILFYQDIGMDAYSYFLAYSRLAPVQCVSFGHPDTTGIPAMDYWVSAQNFETEDAQGHYSEELFLLQGVGSLAYYYKPELKTPKTSKEHFGLNPNKHIYLCPQSLFKVHPDFDEVLGNILRGDPNGEVVLVEAQSKTWTDQLCARFERTMTDVVGRIRFVPKLSEEDFLGLIAASDVMLDTLYFNGMNTTLEALAVGTPVVTMPTRMQRGRHAFGIYQRMQYEACIAKSPQHYVEIALRLGKDEQYREVVRADILSRNAVLYEDLQVVREFERFFSWSFQQAR